MKRVRIQRWLPGIGITLLLTVVAVLQFGRGAEALAYRAGLWLVPQRPPSPDVVVVGIDSVAQQKYGAWPWRRDLLAQLTSQLATDKARIIAYVPAFAAPQNAEALHYLDQLASLNVLRKNSDAAAQIATAKAALATDQAFAESIANAGNVILAAYGTLGQGAAASPLPPWLEFKMRVPQPEPSAVADLFFQPQSAGVQPPLAAFGQAAAG
ncbi:MAG: CHASE2 domain-containing protein, partial [Gammaproteobacteria bacterium]|nr:CHASE2 domain-containing protein [Gammaproteobacteria bacterium]MBU6510653.1 CHASE2 domain-containing protein [Gammaproteobacteria bacterium]MDE2109450.1 CHASE2 domain-containing protein [Gammaproteobacteria bacterium]